MCLAFGVEKLDDVAEKLGEILELQPPQGLVDKVRSLGKLKSIADSMPKEVSKARVPGGRPHRRRRRPRPAPDPALLAARPGAVHHAARGDHEGPADGRAQRRHVPDAEDRPALDVHALADPQGRPRRPARRARRPDPRRRRARARPGHRLLGERAAAEAHRRADGRRLPQGLAGRARASARRSTSRCRRTRRSCSRAGSTATTSASKGPFGDHTGFYTPPEEFPIFRISRDHDAPRRDLPVDRRRQAAGRGRVAREGDRAHLPARDPDERARDRRLRPADRRHVPQLRDRLDPQALPRPRAGR